jgi:hypothetical protein
MEIQESHSTLFPASSAENERVVASERKMSVQQMRWRITMLVVAEKSDELV